jgi:hypothetical protein
MNVGDIPTPKRMAGTQPAGSAAFMGKRFGAF